MKTIKIYIEGMTCKHCIQRVSNALDLVGIENAEVEIGEAIITFDENEVNIDKIAKALEETGYRLKSWQSQ